MARTRKVYHYDDVTVEITGSDELADKLKRFPIVSRSSSIKGLSKVGEFIEDAQKERARDRTGLMRERIFYEIDKKELSVEVGPDWGSWYAVFQEYGTPLSPAYPFIRPSVDNRRDRIFWILVRELEKGLERIGHGIR